MTNEEWYERKVKEFTDLGGIVGSDVDVYRTYSYNGHILKCVCALGDNFYEIASEVLDTAINCLIIMQNAYVEK